MLVKIRNKYLFAENNGKSLCVRLVAEKSQATKFGNKEEVQKILKKVGYDNERISFEMS